MVRSITAHISLDQFEKTAHYLRSVGYSVGVGINPDNGAIRMLISGNEQGDPLLLEAGLSTDLDISPDSIH